MKSPAPERQRRNSLQVCNHCPDRRLDLRLLRRMIRNLLRDQLHRPEFHLDIHFVCAADITRLNENYLRHRGSTDVIAFDYSEAGGTALCGEVFVCVPEAFVQARRFRTPWQSELIRYVVHAILHLSGYDDRSRGQRRKMKSAEDTALARLAGRYDFSLLAAAGVETRRRTRASPGKASGVAWRAAGCA